jgi:hypothetical protein
LHDQGLLEFGLRTQIPHQLARVTLQTSLASKRGHDRNDTRQPNRVRDGELLIWVLVTGHGQQAQALPDHSSGATVTPKQASHPRNATTRQEGAQALWNSNNTGQSANTSRNHISVVSEPNHGVKRGRNPIRRHKVLDAVHRGLQCA